MNGDMINQLPVDNLPLSDKETYIYNTIFLSENNQKSNSKLRSLFILFLIVTALFFIVNLEPSEKIIKTIFPILNVNMYAFTIFKAFVFTIFLFVIENFNVLGTNSIMAIKKT